MLEKFPHVFPGMSLNLESFEVELRVKDTFFDQNSAEFVAPRKDKRQSVLCCNMVRSEFDVKIGEVRFFEEVFFKLRSSNAD